jgi:hypothetical protein
VADRVTFIAGDLFDAPEKVAISGSTRTVLRLYRVPPKR